MNLTTLGCLIVIAACVAFGIIIFISAAPLLWN